MDFRAQIPTMVKHESITVDDETSTAAFKIDAKVLNSPRFGEEAVALGVTISVGT